MVEFLTFASDLEGIVTAVQEALPLSNIGVVITTVVSAGAGGALMWWGGRKVVNAIKNAVFRGKLRF